MMYRTVCKLAFMLAVSATQLAPLRAQAMPTIGQPLQAFSVTTPSGQHVNNQNYSERVLLLVFSTEYCSACKKAIPALVKLAERYGKKGFYVLGLFSDNSVENEELTKYMHTFGVTYPMALFEQRLAAERFGMMSVPYSLLVDKKGVVAGIYYGFSDKILTQVEEQIKKLLTE